jgi:hypothetical protein
MGVAEESTMEKVERARKRDGVGGERPEEEGRRGEAGIV